MNISLPPIQAAVKAAMLQHQTSADAAAVAKLNAVLADKSLDPHATWLPFKHLFDAMLAVPAGKLKQALMEIYHQYVPEYVKALEQTLKELEEMLSDPSKSPLMDMFNPEALKSMLGNALPAGMSAEKNPINTVANRDLSQVNPMGLLPEEQQTQFKQMMENFQQQMMPLGEVLSKSESLGPDGTILSIAGVLNAESEKFYTQLIDRFRGQTEHQELLRLLKEFLYFQKRVDAGLKKALTKSDKDKN